MDGSAVSLAGTEEEGALMSLSGILNIWAQSELICIDCFYS